jgi:hypothetical protein
MVPDPQTVYVTLHMDTDFTPAERKQLERGAEVWHKGLNGLVRFKLVYDLDFSSTLNIQEHDLLGHNMVFRMESWFDTVIALDAQAYPGELLGIVNPPHGIFADPPQPVRMLLVADRMYDNRLPQVFAHELGHVLGTFHDPHPSALMFGPYTTKPLCLTAADVALVCKQLTCGTLEGTLCP